MKLLVCCESEIVRGMVSLALQSAGHLVIAGGDPLALVPAIPGSKALVVDHQCCKQAVALLRDRGFAGRSLLVGDATLGDLASQARDAGTDGALWISPPEDLARRFAAAVRRRRVLIVDDSEIVAKLLRAELEPKGFEVHFAPSAEKAAPIIFKRATRPDLILLDIGMPKVDGAQFCKFVKGNSTSRSIKVILCSGQSREKLVALAAECAADGYIEKSELLGKWIAENTV